MNDTRRQTTVLKALLAVGFLAFVGALAFAYSRPATGYEISIYQSTPTGFWIGTVIAGIIGLTVTFAPPTSRRLQSLGLALVTAVAMSVFALPLIRSYFFYGAGDSMTHLGWAEGLSSGSLGAFGFIYPVVHMMSLFLSDLSGFELTYTLQFVPLVVFPLICIVSTMLCVQYLTDSKWAMPVGLGAGLLLLPINHLSIHLMAHPSSQAILFLPFVLYLVFRFVNDPSDRFAFATPSGIALAVTCIAIVFIHPQEAMSLIALLGAIAAVQFGYKRFRPTDRIAQHRPLYAHTILTFLVFASWVPQHERPVGRIQFVIQQFRQVGVSAGAEQTETQASSLAALGGSIEGIFVKLLLVTLIICLFAAAVMAANLFGKLSDRTPGRTALVTYLTVGLVPLGGLFLVVFIADQGDHYFRFMGFMMVSVTILGAVAISKLASRFEANVSRSTVATGLVVMFTVMVAMQGLAMHPSPYYYQANNQVTESSMEGYSFAFEHNVEDTTFRSLRGGSVRYLQAHYGRPTASQVGIPQSEVRGEVFNTNLSTHYDDDQYLGIRDSNYEREVGLYDGLRYTDQGFRSLETESNIYRVQDNGGFRLYLIRNEG
jgi:hypothetical protein